MVAPSRGVNEDAKKSTARAHTYLDIISVVVGPQVYVRRSGRGHDPHSPRQAACLHQCIEQVISPTVPLDETAEPLIPSKVANHASVKRFGRMRAKKKHGGKERPRVKRLTNDK